MKLATVIGFSAIDYFLNLHHTNDITCIIQTTNSFTTLYVRAVLSQSLFITGVLKAPFTRYNLLSNRLSKRFDNQLNVCIHDTTGCQTGCIVYT